MAKELRISAALELPDGVLEQAEILHGLREPVKALEAALEAAAGRPVAVALDMVNPRETKPSKQSAAAALPAARAG